MIDIDTAINTQPDFIALKRFEFSLTKLLARYPQGVPAHITAAALHISESELMRGYGRIVTKLQGLMGVSPDAL